MHAGDDWRLSGLDCMLILDVGDPYIACSLSELDLFHTRTNQTHS